MNIPSIYITTQACLSKSIMNSLNSIQKKMTAIVLVFLALTYGLFHFFHSKCFKARLQKGKQDPSFKKDIDSFKKSLHPIKNGYAILPFFQNKKVDHLFEDLKNFDSQSESYKQQFIVKDQFEIGYSSLTNKKLFVIRNKQVPDELKSFLPYIISVHHLCLKILKTIEEDLNLVPGQLTETVSKAPFPPTENSSSLLRLFAYDPSSEEGAAAAAHKDLGLLTIIPCSQVPALEVIDDQKEGQWINVEKIADKTDVIVLAGRTLELMTKGKYQAASHQVKNSPKKRFSIVYQLRAEPNAQISTPSGVISVGEWLDQLKKNLTSINKSF